jgi:flagellar protein FlgJ
MTSLAITNTIANALDAAQTRKPPVALGSKANAAARDNAEKFEATFLNSMFQHMFTNVDGDGPVGGSTGIGVWRSFLTDEFAKSVAKNGGIGLADPVYRSLIAHQEATPQ